MIITTLFGGLGNQMFHYAIARSFYESKPQPFLLDTFYLQHEEEDIEKIIQRPFALDIFKSLKAKVADQNITSLLHGKTFADKVKRKLFFLSCSTVQQKLMERVALPNAESVKNNLLIIGNFQSESYFKNCRQQLLHDYEFPALDGFNEDLKKRMESTPDSVSVHVRRGDYLSSSNRKIFTSVNINYYLEAIHILKNKLKSDKLNAFVFTDDIEWVKNHFPKDDRLAITYVCGNTSKNSWKDMALMTACKHHIIANSSFSWWGAWLSTNTGITIAPKHWYLPNSYAFDINDIVPDNWMIADYKIDN